MFVIHWPSILALLTRRYPFLSGCGTLANSQLMKALSPDSPEECWAKSPGGYLRVFLNDFIGRSIFFFGDLDPKLTWVLKRLLKPGDRVIDVGANIGAVTLWMSKLVGPRGTVYAFEPNPALSSVLQSALDFNAITNVKLHTLALGSSDGKMELQVPIGKLGAGSLVRRTRRAAKVYTVPVKKLDEIILGEPGEVALMKLDVEGFELEVLKGARRVLQERRPSAIIFESNELGAQHERSAVVELLHECGYEFLMIPRCYVWMKTKVVNLDQSERMYTHDLVAAPKGEAFARISRQLRARQ